MLENDSLYIKEIKKIKIENRRLEAYITKLKLESIKNNTTEIKMADLAEIAKRVNNIIPIFTGNETGNIIGDLNIFLDTSKMVNDSPG